MTFRVDDCHIPIVWCGKGQAPKGKKYSGTGSRYVCLQKGIGVGKYQEIRKTLPATSLRNIKYIGEKYERQLSSKNIKTIAQLKEFARKNGKDKVEKTLKKAFTNSSGNVDYRAYNSTLEYLYRGGIKRLPQCKKLK